jgi:small subunit ribosomal protein S16
MAVRIRLRKVGRKRQPSYRIVVSDSRSPRDGAFVELLGHYYPRAKEKSFEVDVEKARSWLARGATPSETVASILKKAGCFAVELPKPPITGG